MRISKVIPLGLLAVVGLWGCGSPEPDSNGAQPPHQDVGGDLGSAVQKAGGDYDKLPDNLKKQILDAAHGDEKAARAMVKRMAAPAPHGPGGPNVGGG